MKAISDYDEGNSGYSRPKIFQLKITPQKNG